MPIWGILLLIVAAFVGGGIAVYLAEREGPQEKRGIGKGGPWHAPAPETETLRYLTPRHGICFDETQEEALLMNQKLKVYMTAWQSTVRIPPAESGATGLPAAEQVAEKVCREVTE